jgi:hypothetical protein
MDSSFSSLPPESRNYLCRDGSKGTEMPLVGWWAGIPSVPPPKSSGSGSPPTTPSQSPPAPTPVTPAPPPHRRRLMKRGGGGALGTAPARAGAATTGLARWRHHRGRGVLPADGRRLVEVFTILILSEADLVKMG